MTQEEIINLRERAYRMAHELSVSGTSRHKVLAAEIFEFLTAGLKIPGEQEIDWSRPQLVRLIAVPHIIIKTTGEHDAELFHGAWIDTPDQNFWRFKSNYVYHGEIPDQKIPATKESGMNFLEAARMASQKFDIKRASSSLSFRLYYGNKFGVPDVPFFDPSYFTLDDILATDWQIVKG